MEHSELVIEVSKTLLIGLAGAMCVIKLAYTMACRECRKKL